jgi:hypothetical protein
MTQFRIPAIDIDKVATDIETALRDGAYVAIGLGVLAFQRAQVRRAELTRQLEDQIGPLDEYFASAREQAESQVHALRTYVADLARTLDEKSGPLRSAVGLD